MFSPRWVWLVPAGATLAAGIVLRQRSAFVAALALIVAAWPVMGLSLPWGRLSEAPSGGIALRVMTCNMHYGKADPALLDGALDTIGPDVVALQEWRDSARSAVLDEASWHVHRVPGLCLASRHPITRVQPLGDHSTSPKGLATRYVIETPGGLVTVISLHLDSPREGLGQAAGGVAGQLQANSDMRRRQSEYLAKEAATVKDPLLVVGDFNTPPESVLFRHIWGGYVDAFGSVGFGWGYTFVNRRTSVRIDHVLVGGFGRAVRCWVGPDVGSPHRPVIADVAWPPASGATR
jgi:endonuclease/exonuclease/phosphatase (EEP) superfamily protein YafD